MNTCNAATQQRVTAALPGKSSSQGGPFIMSEARRRAMRLGRASLSFLLLSIFRDWHRLLRFFPAFVFCVDVCQEFGEPCVVNLVGCSVHVAHSFHAG